jgi:hypothetical protein
MQTIVEILVEQALKTRGILDNEFLQLVIAQPIKFLTQTLRSEGKGADLEAAEAESVADQQALQSGASVDQAVQRAL